MILILSGTEDGREMVHQLTSKGYPLLVTTATEYGASLIEKSSNIRVLAQRLDLEDMKKTIIDKEIRMVIDATHPYAVEVSQNAMKACRACKITYLRYQRKESIVEEASFIHEVASYEEAIEVLKKMDGHVLLSTGSKTLDLFVKELGTERLYPRVLPTSNVIKKCEALGFKPSNILAIQGPFSVDMNIAMIQKYEISVLVSKDSGKIGGMEEKLEAVKKTNTTMVLIKRPEIEYENVSTDVKKIMDKVSEMYEAISYDDEHRR